MMLHRRLPAWDAAAPAAATAAAAAPPREPAPGGEPRVHRAVPYSPAPGAPPRCIVDVYVPPGAGGAAGEGAPAPVVLFCHGGVWAAGGRPGRAPPSAGRACRRSRRHTTTPFWLPLASREGVAGSGTTACAGSADRH
jgi:acetyl esterase/lipase